MPAHISKSPEERELMDLSPEEMDTVKRSRPPIVVLTANGEVHTHEEAQVFVHDLNLFVTVQLLEEVPAVLLLGKLCEDHGYSYERVSGQKPRLTKEGKTIICKTYNFVPPVVRGLSPNSGSVSSSTSSLQDSSSSSSGAVLKRSDEMAPESWCDPQKQKKKKEMTGKFRTRRRIDCIGTQFSGIRLGTSCRSGIKIKEAQYLYSLPKRPKL